MTYDYKNYEVKVSADSMMCIDKSIIIKALGTVIRGCVSFASTPESPHESQCMSGDSPARVGRVGDLFGSRHRSLPQTRVSPLVETVAHTAKEDSRIAPVGRR